MTVIPAHAAHALLEISLFAPAALAVGWSIAREVRRRRVRPPAQAKEFT